MTHFLALGRFLAARAAALWVDTEDQNSGGSRLGIHYIPLYAIIYHDIPLYTIVYNYIPLYTIIYHSIPFYAILYQSIPLYTTIYHYTNISQPQFMTQKSCLMLFGQPKCWYFRHQPWVSRKLKLHEKDIHKFGKVPSLSTHLHKFDGKFGRYRFKIMHTHDHT